MPQGRKIKTLFSYLIGQARIRYKQLTVAFVVALVLILGCLILSYRPTIRANWIIYVTWENGFGYMHVFMLPSIYTSIAILVFSIVHLRKKVKESLDYVQNLVSPKEAVSKEFSQKQLSLILSLKANVFAFVAVALFFLIEYKLSDLGSLIYANWPIFVYFSIIYSIIVFLATHFAWLFLTSTYVIHKFSKIHFRIDLERLGIWIRSDRLGGVKVLSDLSLRFTTLCIIGVLLFSPAPLLYRFYLYTTYLFAILVTVTSIFLVSQFQLHRVIKRQKERLSNTVEKELKGIVQVEYIFYIEQVKEWPVNLQTIIGMLLSNIIWPIIMWYLFTLLGNTV